MRHPMNIRILLFISLALVIALAGCSVVNPPEPTPVSTPILVDSGEVSFRGAGVVASGEVAPVIPIEMSSEGIPARAQSIRL